MLLAVAAAPAATSLHALADATATPRATAYRIVRTLMQHGLLKAGPGRRGEVMLGPAAGLLGGVATPERDLVSAARPVLERLALELGETVKLVVRDQLCALTVAVADTGLDGRVVSRTGTRVPLHIGASQRLLLAHAPAATVRAVLAGPLERRTSRTVVDGATLRSKLALLRRVDSEQSHGEGIEGIGAAACLVRGAGDVPLGALVAVYVHAGKGRAQLERIREAVVRAAGQVSGWGLAGAESPGPQASVPE